MDLRKAFYIAKKDMKEYYLKPGSVSWGLLFPIAFSLAFMMRRGISEWLAPGMISLSIFFGATSMSAMSIVFERRIGSFERLILFPVSYFDISLGKSLSSFFMGLISAIPVIFIAILLTKSFPVNFFLLIISIALANFASSSFGVLISFAIKDPSQTMTIFNLIRFPMMFLSNVIFPVKEMIPALKIVSFASPLTYVSEALRYGYSGSWDLVPPWISFPLLFTLGVTFLLASSKVIERGIP